jgi:hypothetical protein
MKHINAEEEKEELARIKIPHELREILEKEIKNKTIEFFIEGESLVLRKNNSKSGGSIKTETSQKNSVCLDNIALSSEEEDALFKHLLRKKRQSYSKEESKFIWKR